MFTKTPYLLLVAPLAVFAEDNPIIQTPAPVFFEQTPADVLPSETIQPPKPAAPVHSDGLSGQSLEARISQAVRQQNWADLEPLLTQYRLQNGHDPILYDYALGALRRSQLRHQEAVSLYRGIVGQQPDLAYPRFDLGVMLFENKQYREAAAELQRAKPDLQPAMQQFANKYLEAIDKAQGWQPELSFQYEQTDNVNNASDAKTIEFAGKTWQKTADSLPHQAHGIRYGLGIAREANIGGHHFAHVDLSGSGVHYWDNQDYNEQSLNLAAGYKNHTAMRSFGLVPFVAQNWLGGARYSRSVGTNAEFSRRLNNKWRVNVNAAYIWKHYQDENLAQRYNSTMPYLGATLIYAAPKNWLLYGGADWSHDMTKEAEQASVRKGLRLGVLKSFANGFGLRTNLRYTRRTFDAPGTLIYKFTRKDHEYQANAAVWHRKISWKGFTPNLNFRHLNIDSNMKGFYSRKSNEWFISVEKAF